MPWTAPVSEIPLIKDLGTLITKLAGWLSDLVRTARFYDLEAPVAYGTTVRPSGNRGGPQLITVTDNAAFTVAAPSNPREGFIITLDFLNSSEGSVGTVTFDAAYVLDGAFRAPGIDLRASYRFLRSPDGKWREIERNTGPAAPPPTGPTADFTVVKSGLTVTITDASVPAAGTTITAWDYDWGDGTPHATTANPNHTYATEGQKTITLTVTDSNAATGTRVRTPTLSDPVTGTTLGVPFGPMNLFATTSLLEPQNSWFTMSEGSVTSGMVLSRLAACKAEGLKYIPNICGGGRAQYLTGGKFDRRIHSARMQTFNTSAIITAFTEASSPVLGTEVMDEPGNDGGPGNMSNSWGPTGTMSKSSRTPQEIWYVQLAANAAAGDIAIVVQPLPYALLDGDLLTFLPGQGKTVIIDGNQAAGDTVINCLPLVHSLSTGDNSMSNSVDNLCQEAKNIFGAAMAVGVTMDYSIFQSQHFLVTDFIISQYRYAKSNGNLETYISAAEAIGTRDGHKIAYSINIIDGGIPGSKSGCPDVWICGANTGGRGSYCANCNVTPAQLEAWGKRLTEMGTFVLMWKYYSGFMDKVDNQAAFKAVADYAATQTFGSLHR